MARKKEIEQLTIWDGIQTITHGEKPKSRRELLAEANAQAKEMLHYSALDHANIMAGLFQERKIPIFYFIEAAQSMGLEPQVCRQWHLMDFPIPRTRDTRRIEYTLEIFLKVYLRLAQYSKDESYPQAILRLKEQVQELEDRGITHNQISQHLRMAFRTLQDVLNKATTEDVRAIRNTRQKYCPWEQIEKLELIEEAIRENRLRRKKHHRVQREYSSQGPRIPAAPPEGSITTTPNGNCGKCGQSWVHLYPNNEYPNGENAWGYQMMSCRACGADNMLVDDPHEEPEEIRKDAIIERYAPCAHCSAPWHNLTREETLEDGSTKYLCMICFEMNTVLPKPKNSAWA